jgi:hypothetical protein
MNVKKINKKKNDDHTSTSVSNHRTLKQNNPQSSLSQCQLH